MLCEKCKKNEATGQYEGTVNGIKTSMRLCTKCLLEKQKELFGGLGMFSGFVNVPVQKRRCSKCGTDLSKVIKTLFVGCPYCYGEFGDQLLPLIKNIQNATAHVGSAPAGMITNSEIESLKEQLRLAISQERFEDAAVLNRRLKALKEQSQQS
jgi:protein arginine kinase activator